MDLAWKLFRFHSPEARLSISVILPAILPKSPLFGPVRPPLYVLTRLSNPMVGSLTPTLSAENNRIELKRTQLAATLTLLMLSALLAPSLLAASGEPEELANEPTRFPTANGTIDDSDAQTLLTNLNANNPIDVMGVMDDSNRIHLVWIENTSTPLLRYALIQISTGVDTVLISTTQVGGSNASSLSGPSMVIDSQGRAHIVWEVTDTDILYTLLDPSEDDLDGSSGDIQNLSLIHI